MKKLLFSALCGLVSLPCLAGDWRFIAASDRLAYAYEASTMETINGITGVWIMARPEYHRMGEHIFELTWEEYDCKRKVSRTINGFGAFRDLSGKGQMAALTFDNTSWQRALPKSISAELLKKVCNCSGDPFSTQDDYFTASEDLLRFMRSKKYW